MRIWAFGAVAFLFVACGGGGSDPKGDSSNPSLDGWQEADEAGSDVVTPADLTADGVQPGDVHGIDNHTPDQQIQDPDIPPGSGELGDPCQSDSDCKSLLCWATHRGTGCTQKCESQADCQAYGLACM